MLKKILIGVGVTLLVVIGFFGWLWYNNLHFTDFFKSPSGRLDDTIYHAQEAQRICGCDRLSCDNMDSDDCFDGDDGGALADFQRDFTRDTYVKYQELHDTNTELMGTPKFDPSKHWTWPIIIDNWANMGGFEVTESIDLWDRMGEMETRLTISYDEGEKKKVVKFIKKTEIWRIDGTTGAEYRRAWNALQRLKSTYPDVPPQ